MLTRRLHCRTPWARTVGVVTLAGHKRHCNKVNKDGSGRSGIVPAVRDRVVHGVLLEIALRVAAYDLGGAQAYVAEEMFAAARRLDT